ncbi:siderophore biosynthesis-related protein [Acrocarpospora phusangensis]|uniref:Siderophore biosynthesis-related protein n=1 Tax=Acrocarpospora phusangensis TaxID=1070424 RepID=A0A919UMK7_9ACTN|nr:4-hydroxyphenylacetate 3-hydroxylase N-terminal domain-containing protein [Acrocarpospora phusangensis]GIH23403.1 siderophore biosynthesis-related protein [Acrocarpospora phusangensis]
MASRLRTKADYLNDLRDGRNVYVGGELVTDVTTHEAFRNAADSVGDIYAAVSDPKNEHLTTYIEEETGDQCSLTFLRPRNRDDIVAKRKFHQVVSETSNGLLGRTPDHVGSSVTGMASQVDVFTEGGYPDHVLDYWRFVRDRDLYVAHAVAPPSGTRSLSSIYDSSKSAEPVRNPNALRVVDSDSEGVTVHGVKVLATSAVLADEIWIGNILPLRPGDEAYSVSFAVPVATEGLKLISRTSFEGRSRNIYEYPLAATFDETDSVLVFDNVKVPWERVFTFNGIAASVAAFNSTPAHALANLQAHVRLLVKSGTMLGLTRVLTEVIGTSGIPGVQDELRRMALYVGMLDGLIQGQENNPEPWSSGFVSNNREVLYATMAWSSQEFPRFALRMRELIGGHPFRQPADLSAFGNDETVDAYLRTSGQADLGAAKEHYQLMRTAWDLIGSEYASRHLQYEMFYAGPPHVTNGHLGRAFDWHRVDALAERLTRRIREKTDAQPA